MKTARRARSSRNAPVVLGSILLLGLFSISLATLPYAIPWHNVQALTLAIRHEPSLAPVVPFKAFVSDDAAGLNRENAATDVSAMTRLAYRATSWFGHDDLGRSLFYRVWPGFLVSLAIGLSAAIIAAVIGTTWGATAAIFGGRVDRVMMRVVDVLYGLPYILMVILLKIGLTEPLARLFGGVTVGADLAILLMAIGGVSWLTMARVVRGQVLALKSQPYVEAARVTGASTFYLLRRHIVPNLVGPILTYAMLVIPQAILQESFLSFLGIGVQAPTPSLGRLAADGIEAVNTFVGFWWLIVFPCAMLVIALVSFNFIGDALRDSFAPKSNQETMLT